MTPPRARRDRVPEERRRRIAQRIRALREALQPKVAQGELATRAGIDPATMNQIEQARRLPDLATVISLAEQLGVQPSAILDDETKAGLHATTGGVEPLSLSTIQAATTAALADLVTAIVAALTEWHATHVYREDGRSTTGTAGQRRVLRNDRG